MDQSKPKKKRKNPWIKRRAKKKFQNRLQKIESSDAIQKKIAEHEGTLSEITEANSSLQILQQQYLTIMNMKISSLEAVMEALPVESLRDSIELDKLGRASKAQFRDFLKASEIKKRGQELIERKNDIISDARIAQIELIKTKIEELDRILEEEE